MHRQEREIKDTGEMEKILQAALVCRIALADGDKPYVVPVNFGYREGCLYFHCATTGKKLDIIKKNPNICFEADADVELIKGQDPCRDWSMKYRSVIGFGRACILEDPDEKTEGLEVLMSHYSGQETHEYDDSIFRRVAVVKIEIDTMTGKKSV